VSHPLLTTLADWHLYVGLAISAAALGGVLALNQAIYKRRWNKYPTAADYVAAHPKCLKDGKPACYRCGGKPLPIRVRGKGRVFRCSHCEDEVFREDAT